MQRVNRRFARPFWIAVTSFVVAWHLLAAPSPMEGVQGPESGAMSLSLAQAFLSLAPALLPILLIGTIAACLERGGAGAAFRCILGRADAADDLLAADALARSARAFVAAGTLVGLLGLLALFVVWSRASSPTELSPARAAVAIHAVLFSPAAGLWAGRLLLAPIADAIRVGQGGARRAVFSPAEDAALLALLILPAVALAAVHWKF